MRNRIIEEDLIQISNSSIDWNQIANKTVLITGASGFLPAYMVESILYLNENKLVESPAKIIALVRNITKAKERFDHYKDRNDLQFLQQDVCSKINYDGEIDFIIHAASQASPKYYKVDPVGTLSANTIGTINILELARRKGSKCLYFSSSEIYGSIPIDKLPVSESFNGDVDPLNIRSCYSESKRMGENICISYIQQYNLDVKIVRPFHTYGPKVSLVDGRVFADFVNDILNKRDIVMKSDGSATRSFCYLSDATIGFFMILLNGKVGEAYNLSGKDEVAIAKLADIISSISIYRETKVIKKIDQIDPKYMVSKVSRSCGNTKKLESLGWKQTIQLKKGFERTIRSFL